MKKIYLFIDNTDEILNTVWTDQSTWYNNMQIYHYTDINLFTWGLYCDIKVFFLIGAIRICSAEIDAKSKYKEKRGQLATLTKLHIRLLWQVGEKKLCASNFAKIIELKLRRRKAADRYPIISLFCMSHQAYTLIKKKIKFSSYIRKFRVEQLQSHIWERAP
jgi:hypothetical protein